MTHLEQIHREDLLDRLRRKRAAAQRSVAPVMVPVESPSPVTGHRSPVLTINDSASKAKSRPRGAQKVKGRRKRPMSASELGAARGRRLSQKWQEPEFREQMLVLHRERMRAQWEDPAFREKMAERWSPARRAEAAQRMQAMRQVPGFVEKHVAAMHKLNADPDFRAARSAAMAKNRRDPAFNAKIAAGRARSRARAAK